MGFIGEIYNKLYLAVYLKRPQMIGILLVLYPLQKGSRQVKEEDRWTTVLPAFLSLLFDGFAMKYMKVALGLVSLSGLMKLVLAKDQENMLWKTLIFLYGIFQIVIGVFAIIGLFIK